MMQASITSGIRYYQFASLAPYAVDQAVFTRHGGVSPQPYATLNMSVSTGDSPDNVRANRIRAFEALGRDPESVADLWQTHSADVVVADAPNGLRDCQGHADVLITDRPAVTLFLRFADCVPILLLDAHRQVIGLVHAGWQGTLKKAAAAAVLAMKDRYGSRAGDILAAIGPSIGPCHYAVGTDVVEKARHAFPDNHAALLVEKGSGFHLDLWAANRQALADVGVTQVETAEICTACRTDDFFSHRGEQAKTGRFAALIGLRQDH